MASLFAVQANILVSLSLAFASTLLATFALGILSLALALVLPESSCHRAVAVRRSPSVLCSSHWLHDASGKLPTLLLLHARHPQALVKDCPRLESLRIQQQVRRKLCARHPVQNNPHTQAT